MKYKALATSALVASLSFAPVSPMVKPAHADGKDVIAGLIVGGIIGAAINEEAKKKKKRTTSTKSKSKSSKSSVSSATRAANVEVQESLNFFGWSVGSADGAIGPKSRAAISEYQIFLGHGATGQLTEQERTILVTAHARAKAGGAAISDIVSSSVYGIRGVILAQRDEMETGSKVAAVVPGAAAAAGGVVGAAAAGAIVPEPPAPAPVIAPITATAPAPVPPAPPAVVAAPAPIPSVPVAEPEPEEEDVAAAPSLPSFMDPNGGKGALSAACNSVALAAGTAGGYVTADTMTDANVALAEQFCLTRASAIATGDGLASKVAGFSAEQISQQCAGFGPVMKDHVAALSMRPADEVLAGVEAFVLNSGQSPAQLAGTAKVCLGVGYKTDQMDVAIASALMLAAMGETGYAELLGHHLTQGYGATQRPDLAMTWYELAIGALDGGSDVFMPGMPGRDDLIRKASYTIAGRAWELAPQPKVEEASLPGFSVPSDAPEADVAAAPAEVAPVAPAAVAVAPAPEADPAPVAVVGVEPAPMPDPVMVAPEAAPETATAEPAPASGVMQVGSDVVAGLARAPLMIFAVGF